MKLQQLIVASPSPNDFCDNVIVAQSKNIAPALLEMATKWATVRNAVASGQSVSTFYFNTTSGTGVIGRSFPSGFDRQGNRALYTHFVLATSNQLKCYYNNPVLIARSLNSNGTWILKTSPPAASLPELEMSDFAVNPFACLSEQEEVKRTRKAVQVHDRVGITDAPQPLSFVGEVLQTYQFEKRAKISFAINRRVAGDTLFKINVYSQGNIRLEHELSEFQIYPLRLRSRFIRSS